MSHRPEYSVARFEQALVTATTDEPSAEFDQVRKATFIGRDHENLVTAVVDSEGVVVRIRFGTTATSRDPRQIEDAIVAAVTAAHREMARAWQDAAARVDAVTTELADTLAEFERTELADLERRAREVWAHVRV